MDKITNILNDDKFELLRFYFDRNGFFLIEDLSNFDFNNLFFIPGVDNTVISEAIELLNNNNYSYEVEKESIPESFLNQQQHELAKEEETNSEEPIIDNNLDLLSQAKEAPEALQQYQEKNKASILDMTIIESFSNFPKIKILVYRLKKRGKVYVKDLEENDFLYLVEGDNLYEQEVKLLREGWLYLKHIDNDVEELDKFLLMSTFRDLPKGNIFLKYCEDNKIRKFSDLLKVDFRNLKIKNIGTSTLDFIYSHLIETLKNPLTNSILDTIKIDSLPPENYYVKFASLGFLKIGNDVLNELSKKGISNIEELRNQDLEPWLFFSILHVLKYLETPISNYYYNFWEKLPDRDIMVVKGRSTGLTLEELGGKLEMTREGVRQIESKIVKASIKYVRPMFDVFSYYYDGIMDFSNIFHFIQDEELTNMFFYFVSASKVAYFCEYTNSLLDNKLIPKNVNQLLKEVAKEVIGDGTHFSEQTDSILNKLKENNIIHFTLEGFRKYLLNNGFTFYGDFVVKGKGTYSQVCYQVILKNFEMKVKLDQTDSNGDLRKIREIVKGDYPGVELPDNDRALSARLANMLVLCDRGFYCPKEKIIINEKVMDEILNYIDESYQSSFYYQELFSAFQGRLKLETSIDNYHFLHGVLKLLYPDKFDFQKDFFTMKGEKRKNLDQRIENYVIKICGPVSKKQLFKEFKGIKHYVIGASLDRINTIIKWNTNEFIHTNNLKCSVVDKRIIAIFMNRLLDKNQGYVSEKIAYEELKRKTPQFLLKNNITNQKNLFYILEAIFHNDFRFYSPHIASKTFPVKKLTNINIAKVLLQNMNIISINTISRLVNKYGWSGSNFYVLFDRLTKDYIRISVDDFLKKGLFKFSEKDLYKIDKEIDSIIPASGYLALSTTGDYSRFPKLVFDWNEFILESVVLNFLPNYKIIVPDIKNRRIQRNLIIRSEMEIETFEELLVKLMIQDDVNQFNEEELIDYFKFKGLLFANAIPEDLRSGKLIKYKNGSFVLIN